MGRHILTGAPGAGKTTIINALAQLGFDIVRESFMDGYAQQKRAGWSDPFQNPAFLDEIIDLQVQRQDAAFAYKCQQQFFDRSVLCTMALSRFMGRSPTKKIQQAVDQLLQTGRYNKHIFFVKGLGSIASDEVRTLTYKEAEEFAEVHRQVYCENGFICIDVPAMSVQDRVAFIVARANTIN
ncbi:MAG: AAA family ATPase [Symploca sp. SIO1B1]|nr:AAA family ATPase [Symploca sp. SIO1B1]